MDRITIYYIVCGIYIVLGIWSIVEAVQLKIHRRYIIGLVVLSILLAPVGFGLTMYVKYRTTKKNDPPKKDKPGDKKK